MVTGSYGAGKKYNRDLVMYDKEEIKRIERNEKVKTIALMVAILLCGNCI